MASTGDKLNIDLKLTKETNIINNNTYEGQEVQPGTILTANTLADRASTEYGAYITNYTPTNGVNEEGIKWKIFHADTEDNNVYLIADSYVPIKNTAETKNYIPGEYYEETKGRYAFDLGALRGYTNGIADIDSNITNKWLKQYTREEDTTSADGWSVCATAYLLDTTAWSGFKDSTYAEYAVGAPTIELFVASYNKTHPNRTIKTQVEEYGYNVDWSDESSEDYRLAGLDTSESLYVINNTFSHTPTDGVEGMWLASPANNVWYAR